MQLLRKAWFDFTKRVSTLTHKFMYSHLVRTLPRFRPSGTYRILLRNRLFAVHTRMPNHQVPARQRSDKPQHADIQRKHTIVKRILMATAGFLLLHFVIVDAREKWKRRGLPPRLKPPYEIQTIHDKDLNRKFSVVNGYLLPDFVNARSYDDIVNFKVHPDDVFVVSFPKSGTTWVQEIVYLIKNYLDINRAKSIILEERFPYLEFIYPGLKEISKKHGGRLIKSHLPYSLLPQGVEDRKPKVIYIARNPKDTSVSYYHYARMLKEFNYKRSFPEFLQRYIKGDVPYGPWWRHLLEFWERRDQKNILFITYEDLQQDLKKSIVVIADFLGHPLTDEQVTTIADHCSFNSMQLNPATNYIWWDALGLRDKNETKFLRKGKVGDWKNYYSDEQNLRIEEICQEKLLPKGLSFTYHIEDKIGNDSCK